MQDFTDPVRWSDTDLEGGLTFAITSDFLAGTSGASVAVRNAFETWSGSNTNLNFTESNEAYFGNSLGANVDLLAMSPVMFSMLGHDGALALSLVAADVEGKITGVDIFFNTGYAFSDSPGAGEFDIESIALHEIGHAIGLDHPDLADDLGKNYDSSGTSILATGLEVMNSTIAPGEISRVLTSDDLAGREFLYSSELNNASPTTGATSTPPLATPEPTTILLLGSALGALGFFKKRFF